MGVPDERRMNEKKYLVEAKSISIRRLSLLLFVVVEVSQNVSPLLQTHRLG